MNQRTAAHIIALGILVLMAAACGQESGGADTRAASSGFELRGDAERGKPLYERNCASCHGNTGRGDGPAGAALNPPAANLTAGIDAERAYTVTRDGGIAVGLAPTMAPFRGAMDDQAIHDVIAYVLTLEN